MSSPPKVFVTGATGYIGGDALFALFNAHPEWHYTCLVRNSEKGANVAARYPQIRLVYGELSSTSLITDEARQADLVLHFANADDEPSARAIADGLASRSTPGYWIHTSGTGILLYPDIDIKSFGQPSSKIWDDITDIRAITEIPDHAPHRKVDKIVLAAGTGKANATVRTAIVCPPTIYGVGRGTGNTRSIQIPVLSRCFLERQQGFMVGEGLSIWTHVHVQDLSNLYLRIAEEALKPDGGVIRWGPDGYYFAENGEHVWGEICQHLAARAHALNFLPASDIVSLPAKEVSEITGRPLGAVLWGANSRCRASRARKELGWTPQGEALEKSLDEALRIEASSIGLSKGHAAYAAGEA